jgi:hypothetical protein
MMLIRALLILVCGLLWMPVAFAETPPFEVGQVWSLNAPMAPSARVRIGRIENDGDVIHISLWGQPVPEGLSLASPLTMSHLPISREALAASVTSVVTEPPPADLQFEEGYGIWRDDRGGVFTLTVSEIVDAILQTVPRTSAANK